MRILVDYRPALRARTGVGEYIHTLVSAYTASSDDTVTLFNFAPDLSTVVYRWRC